MSQQLAPGHLALHVSGLPKSFDEAKLIELIQKNLGKDFLIDSVFICKDWNTHKSRGSAYINSSVDNAMKIISIMNHMSLGDGDELNITVKYHEAFPREANLYVGNLNVDTDYPTLEKEFGSFGELHSSKLRSLPDKKYAYVQFKKTEDANKAKEELDGANFGGKSIKVTVFQPYDIRVNQNYTSIHVQNFEQISKENLDAIFKQYGELESTYIYEKPKIHENGLITYAASITYKKHEDAVNALKELNGKNLGNQKSFVEVTRQQTKEARRKESKKVVHKNELNLFLSGLTESTNIDSLRKTMEQFGEIDSLRIMYDDDGKSRLYGYCSFKDQDAVNKAKGANGTFVNGAPLMVKNFMPAYLRKQSRPNAFNKAKFNNAQQHARRNNFSKHSKQTKPVHHVATVQPTPAPAPAKILIEAIPKAEFDGMDDEDKHETFGEKIYEYVQTYLPNENPGKITGMILESFKNNYAALNSVIANGKIVDKINEAIEVLKKHNN